MTVSHNNPSEEFADRELVITRSFEAPRDLVFQAWTDPKHVVHWWGPHALRSQFHEMDVRPGRCWNFIIAWPRWR